MILTERCRRLVILLAGMAGLAAWLGASPGPWGDACVAQTVRADLMIKKQSEPQSAFAVNNGYQSWPSGGQIETSNTDPNMAAAYEVKIENDGTTATTYVLVAFETGENGWTTTYLWGSADISNQIRGWGWTTPLLQPGGSTVITVRATPGRSVAGNTSKTAYVAAFNNMSDVNIRDIVEATTFVNVVEIPDLLIKQTAQPDTEYALNDVYQPLPFGEQIETDVARPAGTASFDVRLENDGNVARTYVLTATQSTEPGWTITYRHNAMDVTSAIVSGGYSITSLPAGVSTVVTVGMQPGVGVTGGTSKSTTVNVLLGSGDPTPADAVRAVTRLSRPDLLVKAATEPDTAWAMPDVYQDTPGAEQMRIGAVEPAGSLVYQVRVENDGPVATTFLLKGSQTADAGWTVAFRSAAGDATTDLFAGGHTTGILAPGAAEDFTLTLTPAAALATGSTKSVSLAVHFDGTDPRVYDAVGVRVSVDRYPGTPEVLAPAEGAVVGPTPTFRLKATDPDGDLVKFLITATRGSTGRTFSTSPVTSGTETSYTVPASQALASGQWSWRARAVDSLNGEGPWSSPQVMVVNQPPEVPSLIAPAESAVATPTPTFQVSAADPDGDDVTLVIEAQFEDKTRTFTTGAVANRVTASYTVPDTDPMASGYWQWRAKAVDSKGVEGPWSATRVLAVSRNPDVPTLLAPAENAVVSPTPTFRLKAADPDRDSVKFVIELQSDATTVSFTTPQVASDAEAAFTVPTTSALATGPWRFRAKSVDSKGAESDWSAERGIYVNRGPNVPTAVAPADYAVVTPTPTFRLQAVDPDADQVRFSIEVKSADYTGVFDTGLVDSDTELAFAVPDTQAIPVGQHTWRARTVDAKGTESGWGSGRTLLVARGPAVPDLVSPAADGVAPPTPTFVAKATHPDGDTVRFAVEAVLGSVTRTFEFGPVASGAEAVFTVPAEQPLATGTWSWRAKAVDKKAWESAWSAPRTLVITRAPGAAEVLAPDADAVVFGSPLFRLRASEPDGDAVAFVIEATSGDSTKTFRTGAIASGEPLSFAVPADQALAAGVWSWRARAVDTYGLEGDWTSARTLNLLGSTPEATRAAGLSGFGLPADVAALAPADMGLAGARIAAWDPAQQRYLVDAEVLELRSGAGYWVKTTAPAPLRFAGRRVSGAFSIPLKWGWNLISPPYLNAVNWDLHAVRVRRGSEELTLAGAHGAGWISHYAWGWRQDPANPNGGTYVLVCDPWLLPGVESRLEPWRAYWVRANTECELILPAPDPGARAARDRAATSGAWSVQVTARSAGGSDAVVLGMADANLALFAGRPPEPPAGESAVRATIAGEAGSAAVDVRPAAAGKQVWEVLVEPASETRAGQEVTLTWSNLAALPKDLDLTLVDLATGTRRLLRTSGAYTFTSGSGARRFQVVAEPRTGPALAITALDVAPLRSNSRAVRFNLSAAASVDLDVLSPAGRVVRTVARGRAFSAGMNQVVWSGPAAPGVYLVRATATASNGASVCALRPVVITR